MLTIGESVDSPHPRLLINYTWELCRTGDGTVIVKNFSFSYPWFQFDLCLLFGSNTERMCYQGKRGPGICYSGGGPTHWCCIGEAWVEQDLSTGQFYVCPQGSLDCEETDQYRCASWGCETTADWTNKGHLISLSQCIYKKKKMYL